MQRAVKAFERLLAFVFWTVSSVVLIAALVAFVMLLIELMISLLEVII